MIFRAIAVLLFSVVGTLAVLIFTLYFFNDCRVGTKYGCAYPPSDWTHPLYLVWTALPLTCSAVAIFANLGRITLAFISAWYLLTYVIGVGVPDTPVFLPLLTGTTAGFVGYFLHKLVSTR